MSIHNIPYAEPPVEYRTDIPEPVARIEAHVVARDYDLLEIFLTGSQPETVERAEYPDPLAEIDPDAIREYENRMDELRELRIQQSYRELGMDYDIDL